MKEYLSDQPISSDYVAAPTQAYSSKPRVPFILKLLRFGFHVGGRLSPRAAARIAYVLWFTPKRRQIPALERKMLESTGIEHLDINHHRIAAYCWGQSGPTVLLVHGWGGRGTQLTAFVEPLLNSGYRVIGFDAPAHGRSSGKKTNIYEIADVIVALQRHYGSFYSVITHSFGGPCTAMALKRGLETKRVVSISPPATTRWLIEKFLAVLHIPERAGHLMMRRIENTFGINVWDEISMINSIKNITIPGMLIHDTEDEDVPWQEGEAVANAWSNAIFIKTSGLGHRRILRDKFVIESTVRFITARQ